MKVTASAVSLDVEDVATSSRFLQRRFGFAEVMAAGGLASLVRHDIGMNVVCSRRGLPVRPEDQREVHATGLMFAVGLESERARPPAEGVPVTMPLTCEEWGERVVGVRELDGVIVQFVGWNAPTATGQPAMDRSGASAGHDHKREHEGDVASGPCVIYSIPPPLCSPPARAGYAAGLHACSRGAAEAASLGPGPGPEPVRRAGDRAQGRGVAQAM